MRRGPAATFVATALLVSTTAFAQTPASTTASTTTAQDRESPATHVTLIGCVQKESDYRREHNLRRGGRLQTGLGAGDEYMLINATRVSPGSPASSSADCTSAGSGEAFEITGGQEEKFKAFVGKRVEVSGTQKRAKIGPEGRPTGGSDPMGGELHLFEVEVSTVREAAAMTQAQRSETQVQTAPPATTAPATTAPALAPPPAPAPAPTATAGQTPPPAPTTTLPHTASPLPLYGLTSLLLFGAAYGVRRLRMK